MVVFLPSSGITDAVVVSADVPVPGTDVVIHVIDQVSLPESLFVEQLNTYWQFKCFLCDNRHGVQHCVQRFAVLGAHI